MPVVATTGGLPTRLGKYEIMMPLAAGGMARIYIGRTTGIGSFERHVVLKLITPERANDHTAVQMFLDEARLAASLNHQNVGQVFEVGEDGGIHYLAMEYVHGQDLRALLAKAGSQGTRVPLELALTVVAGAAAGLNHAHERRGPDGVPLGIVHRDVSPSNIMIGYDGSVKLLDFGIAKATARSIETQSGIIKGKFAYMAPEQCRGRDVDRRSDVFSLGIILYEISTQHRCFRADSDFDTMHRIVTGDVVRPTRLVQGYPQALEAIVMKALAVDANQRYQSAGLLLEAIEAFAMSARMSLSTMSLGRFMREMFGDQQEPWLTQHGRMATAPIQPKESTISNTNGTGSEQQTAGARSTQPMTTRAAAPTSLELTRDPVTERDEDDSEENEAAWNAKSFPTMHPPVGSTPSPSRDAKRTSNPMLPTVQLPSSNRTSSPSLPTVAPAGSPSSAQPPSGQFGVNAGSGSGPSHTAHPVLRPSQPQMTRPGYAGGAGQSLSGAAIAIAQSGQHISEPSYPRYQASDSDESLQLTPNRRPLFIGLGLAAVGVVVLVVIMLGGGSESDKAPTQVLETQDDPAATPDTTDNGTTPDATQAVAEDTKSTPSDPKKAAKVEEKPDTKTADTKTADTKTADTKTQDTKTADPKTDTPESTGDPTTNKPDENTANVAPTVSISLDITSDPSGADVMLAGKVIGTTPLKTTMPRGTSLATIVVHKSKYVDASRDIDLGEDFKSAFILKRIEDPVAVKKTPRPTPKKDTKPVEKKDTKPVEKKDTKPPVEKKDTKPLEKNSTPKPACQPPGQVDPFDPRPVCK
ncbi:MAG: protein kinase domain-containing protein [Kofleriaceae bacterium]